MPARRRDAINIKTTYDGKGVENAKKGIKSLENASKKQADAQKRAKMISEQSLNSIKAGTKAANEQINKTIEATKRQNQQMKTFKQTKFGKVVRAFVNIVERIAAIVKYTGIAIAVFKVFKKLTEKGGKSLRQLFIIGTHQSGKLLNAIGMIVESLIDLAARTSVWGKVFKDGVATARRIKDIAKNMRDVGYVTNKVSDTVASVGQVIKNAFKKDKVTGTLNIFRHMGNIVKNVGDVMIKAGTKLDAFGPSASIIGAVVSKIGLGVKSLSQIVSKGLKVKDFSSFLDLMKKIGKSFLDMGTFKQILKDIHKIPFLKPWLDSFTQMGKYTLRLRKALETIGGSTFAKKIIAQVTGIGEAFKKSAQKAKKNMDQAKDPLSKLRAMFSSVFEDMKNGFNGVGNNIRSLFDILKNKGKESFDTLKNKAKKGLENIGNFFGLSKNNAKGFIDYIKTSGFTGLKAFVETMAKAGDASPKTFLKAAFNAKIYAAAQEKANQFSKKFRDGFDKLKAKHPLLNRLANLIGGMTKGFQKAYNAAKGFSEIGGFVKNAIRAVKNYLGIQQKMPKTFKENFLAMTQTFRYGVFMFQTLGRWASRFVGGALEATAAWESASRKFGVVFGDFSSQYRSWVTDFSAQTNVGEQTLVKWMGTFQDTFVPLGFAREQAASLSQQVVTLATDVARFNGLKTDEAMNAFSAAMTGSHETVKRFGIIINDVTLNQELMAMGIEEGTKAATEQEKAMARLNIMMKSTTDATGAAVAQAKSYPALLEATKGKANKLAVALGGVMRRMSANVLDAVSGAMDNMLESFNTSEEELTRIFDNIGEIIADTIRDVMDSLQRIDLSNLGKAIEGLLSFVGKLFAVIAELGTYLAPFFNFVLGVMGALMKWIGGINKRFLATVAAVISLIVAASKIMAFAKWLIGLWAVLKEVITAVKTLSVVQSILNAIMAANPAVLIAAALLGLVGIIVAMGAATSNAKKQQSDFNKEMQETIDKTEELKRIRGDSDYLEKLKLMSLEELKREREKFNAVIADSIQKELKWEHELQAFRKLSQNEQERGVKSFYDNLLVWVKQYETALKRGGMTQAELMKKLRERPFKGQGVPLWDYLAPNSEETRAMVDNIRTVYAAFREQFPKTAEEAKVFEDIVPYLDDVINRIMELEGATRSVAKAMSEMDAYDLWGFATDQIGSAINKSKDLVYLGSVMYQMETSMQRGLTNRVEALQLVIDKVLQGKDKEELYNDVLNARKGIYGQLEYNAQEIAALTGLSYKDAQNMAIVDAWLLTNDSERVKTLANQRKELEYQNNNLEITQKRWAQVLEMVSELPEKVRDIGKEIKESIDKNTERFLDNVISADVWRQMTEPKWDDILAIKDLEQKQKVLADVLKKIELDWLTLQDAAVLDYENLDEITEYAAMVKAELKKVKDEIDKQNEKKTGLDVSTEVTNKFLASIPFVEEIKGMLSRMATLLDPFVKQFSKLISNFASTDVAQEIGKFFDGLGAGMSEFFNDIGSKIDGVINSVVVKPMEAIDEFFGGALSHIGNAISNLLSPLFEGLAERFGIFGELVKFIIEELVGVVLNAEKLRAAFEYIGTFITQAVAPLVDAVIGMITPLLEPILAVISMVAKWLLPIFQGLVVLITRLNPLFMALGRIIAVILNIISPLIPLVFQIVEIIGKVLAPMLTAIASPLAVLGQLLNFVTPLLDAFAFAVKLVATPIVVLASIFEWVGNLIYNFGQLINNIVKHLLEPWRWGEGMKDTNLGRIIQKNLEKLWNDPETYEAFKPENVDFGNFLEQANIDDFMTGWQAGLDTGTMDIRQDVSQAVVTRPPDVYNTIIINGSTVVDGLNDLRVVTLQDIIDAMNEQTDYKKGLTVYAE